MQMFDACDPAAAKRVAQVAALLRKAESTDSPYERALLYKKAREFMKKYDMLATWQTGYSTELDVRE